jgi:hypothetical protein
MTSAVTRVASSATVVTLLAANPRRKGVYVFNESTAVLYIKLGSGASLTDYNFRLPTMTGIEVPFRVGGGGPVDTYDGIITGIWAAANAAAQVTEFA